MTKMGGKNEKCSGKESTKKVLKRLTSLTLSALHACKSQLEFANITSQSLTEEGKLKLDIGHISVGTGIPLFY